MGMFDQYPNFEEHFKSGDTFTLEGAKLGAMLNTSVGESQQVLFKISKDGESKVYSALGAGFVGQAQRAEASDFPVEVEFCLQPAKKPGHSPTKVLWPTNQPKPWEQSNGDDDIPF